MQNELVGEKHDLHRLYLFLKMSGTKQMYWLVNVNVGPHFISIIFCWKISFHINLVSYVVNPNYTCNSNL